MKELLYTAEMIERHLKATYQITWATFKLLQAIAAAGGSCSMGEATRRCGVAPSTFTAIADVAERGGWVHRTHSRSDRRSVCLSATTQGLERYADAKEFLDSLSSPDTVTEYLIAVTALTAPEAARQAV